MTALVAVGAGLFGLLVGSFLNVVIHRVPRRESVVRPRSRCPRCGNQLSDRDNIPVVSWLLLRGRCRHCGMSIAPRYPLVEALTGLLFAGVGARFGADWAVPAFLVFTGCLLAVAFIDLEHFIVPNKVLLATVAVGGPLLLAAAAADGWSHARDALIAATVGFGLLLVVNLVYPAGMGMGDVKLAGVEGLFLGYLGVGHLLLGLFLGFLLGSVGGVALIASGIRSRKDHIPFAPFLAAGAYLALLAGEVLLDIYRR